jgi:hypothetical protein
VTVPAAAGFTVTATVAGVLASPPLSFTVSENVSVVAAVTVGATKLGIAIPVLESVTASPAVWVQAYSTTEPSGSLLAAPFSHTITPDSTVCAAPASAVGFSFASGLTVTFTVEAALEAPRLSVTISENVSVVTAPTSGAVNVGCAADVLDSVTVAPWVCDHA